MADFLNAFEAFLSGGDTTADSGGDTAAKSNNSSSQADSSNSKSVGSTQQQQQKLKTSADGSTNRDPIDKSANSETVRKSVSTKEESSVPKPFVPPIKIRNTPPESSAPAPPPIPQIPIKPVNGKVQPPTYPPPDRPGRDTNQLLYLKRSVVPLLWKHKYAWPFKKPVDAEKLNLPDYHKIITQPMDLGTIKKRLMNKYYWSGEECRKDLELIFLNCFRYNKPDQDIVVMGKTLEKLYTAKLQDMMPVERELDFKNAGRARPPSNNPAFKRAFYANIDQEKRLRVEKKFRQQDVGMDFESAIPVNQIILPNSTKKSTNGEYSDSEESESETESEESDEDNQSAIPLDRNRKGGPGYIGGAGRPLLSAPNRPMGAAPGTTPLSERKPIKHHCKYCDQPFISRFVRDMHEKQKHVNGAAIVHHAEKKVAPLKISTKMKPDQPRSSAAITVSQTGVIKTTASVGMTGRGGVRGALRGGGMSGAVRGGGVVRGGVAHRGRGGAAGGYDHANFVDKKHQAMHHQAQRNLAKTGNIKQTKTTPVKFTSNGEKPSSSAAAAKTAELPKMREQSSSSKIPDDMLFPMGDDFPPAIKPEAADTFSNSPGSERGVGTPGSKHSPDSGYISSRGLGMVDSPGFMGEKMSTMGDSFPSLPGDRHPEMPAPNSRPALVTCGMGMTGRMSGQMMTSSPSMSGRQSGHMTSSSSIGGQGMMSSRPAKVLTSTAEARGSRLSQDVEDKLSDLQKELGFVEPTFPHSLLDAENLTMQTSTVKQQPPPLVGGRQQQQQQQRGQQQFSGYPNRMQTGLGAQMPVISTSSLLTSSRSSLPSFTPTPSSLPSFSPTPSSLPSFSPTPSTLPSFSPTHNLSTRTNPSMSSGSYRSQQPPAMSNFPAGMELNVMTSSASPRPISLETRTNNSPRLHHGVPPSNIMQGRPGSINPAVNKAPQVRGMPAAGRSTGLMSVGSSPRPLMTSDTAPVTPAAKVDLLSQTLKLSDLDFESFGDPEPSLIEPQTQELKLEDLKHLTSEPTSLPVSSRAEKDPGPPEDLRDLLEFSTFPFQIEPSGSRGELFFNQPATASSSSYNNSAFPPSSTPSFPYQEVLDQGFQGQGLDFGQLSPFGERKGKQQQQQQQQQQWWP